MLVRSASGASRRICTSGCVCVLLACALAGQTSALANGAGLTPMMGWMAWIRFRCNINCTADPENCVSERLFMQMADTMVSDGWLDAGYEYVSIDDCWQAKERAANGSVVPDPERFPSGMKALADYIHSKGLKFGLYTAMGTSTCQGYPGLGCDTVEECTQAKLDVEQYVSWDIDYIKVDSCKGSNAAAFNTTHPLVSSWFLEGGQKNGRPILYHPSGIALHEQGARENPQYHLFARIANMWRHFADMQPVWTEVASIIEFWAADTQSGHPSVNPNQWENFLSISQPGVFQDPDALLVGNVKNSPSCRPCLSRTPESEFCPDKDHPGKPCICCGTLTPTEELTNMVMWSMWAAPLEIAADLRSIPNASATILKNKEIIAINQDPLVYQARRVANVNGSQVWKKRLADGSIAVALHNANKETAPITFRFSDVGYTDVDHISVRDVINHVDLGVHIGGIVSDPIPGHGVALYNLTVPW